MARTLRDTLKFASAAAAAATLATGCTSTAGDVPLTSLERTPLDRHPVGVRAATEVLEIEIAPGETMLSLSEKAELQAFVIDYRRVGSGPLVMSLPSGGANAQSAVRSLAEVRQIAYETGVDYTDIAGTSYDAAGRDAAPIVIAYRAFEAVAPDCPSVSEVDLSDIDSNAETAAFGCSVRTNLAAMIAEPEDLLGEREIGDVDVQRRQTQVEMWRQGAPTQTTRGSGEAPN
jgi:pilus assembly protein CpaD